MQTKRCQTNQACTTKLKLLRSLQIRDRHRGNIPNSNCNETKRNEFRMYDWDYLKFGTRADP